MQNIGETSREQSNWAEEYYNMMLDEAYNNDDRPDNNGYYL